MNVTHSVNTEFYNDIDKKLNLMWIDHVMADPLNKVSLGADINCLHVGLVHFNLQLALEKQEKILSEFSV